MDQLVSVAAIAFLLALTGYAIILALNNVRSAAVVARSADAERELLRVQVERIMDQRRFEREKNELSWNGFRKFEIGAKVQEGGGICSFYLSPHDKKPLPPFLPGPISAKAPGTEMNRAPIVLSET